MEYINIRSSDVKMFKEHAVWKSIYKDLEEMREMLRDSLEEAPLDDMIISDKDGISREIKGVRKLQGACSMIAHLMELPDLMIAELREKEGRDDEDEREE